MSNFSNPVITLMWDAYTNQIGNMALRDLLNLGANQDVFVEPSTMQNTPANEMTAFRAKLDALGVGWSRKAPEKSPSLVYFVDRMPTLPDYCPMDQCKMQQMGDQASSQPRMVDLTKDHGTNVPAISGMGGRGRIDTQVVPMTKSADMSRSPYNAPMPPRRVGNAGQRMYNSYYGGVFAHRETETASTKETARRKVYAAVSRAVIEHPLVFAKSIKTPALAAKLWGDALQNSPVAVYAAAASSTVMRNLETLDGLVNGQSKEPKEDAANLSLLPMEFPGFPSILAMADVNLKTLLEGIKEFKENRTAIVKDAKSIRGKWNTKVGYNSQDVDPIEMKTFAGIALCAFVADPVATNRILLVDRTKSALRNGALLTSDDGLMACVKLIECAESLKKIPTTMVELARALDAAHQGSQRKQFWI